MKKSQGFANEFMLSHNIITMINDEYIIIIHIKQVQYFRASTYHKKRAPDSLAIDCPQFMFPWENEDFVLFSYETGNPVKMKIW